MCSIVTGFATLCQPSVKQYCSLLKATFDLTVFRFIPFFASISVNHLHTCLRFTTCISARSQRLRIAKRNEKNGSICSSLSSPWGQIDRFNRALFLLVQGNPVLEPLKCKCNSLFAIFLCNLLGMLCRSFFFTQGLRTNLKCISYVILGLDC